MNTIINKLTGVQSVCLGMFAAVAINLNTGGQTTATTDPVGYIARAATYLVTAPLTTPQVQTLHAQNFNQLPPSLRPVYLHAVAVQIGHIVAIGEPLGGAALAGYLQTADPDQFFDIDLPLP